MATQVAGLLLRFSRAVFQRVGTDDRGFTARLRTLGPSPLDPKLVGHDSAYAPARTASIAVVQRSSRVESLTVAST